MTEKEDKASNNTLEQETFATFLIVSIIGIMASVSFITYFVLIDYGYVFTITFPKILENTPGEPYDNRYTYYWVAYLFSLFRFPICLCYMWLLVGLGTSWKNYLTMILIMIGIWLEVYNTVLCAYYWIFCNNPNWLGVTNPCSGKDYCKVYVDSNCPTGSYTGASPTILDTSLNFRYFATFSLVFIVIYSIMFISMIMVGDLTRKLTRVK
jgi:hypothetical protein